MKNIHIICEGYEDFKPSSPTNDNCYFDLDGCISPGCSIKLIPLNYKNAQYCENNSY